VSDVTLHVVVAVFATEKRADQVLYALRAAQVVGYVGTQNTDG
jgi:hypothetical protein